MPAVDTAHIVFIASVFEIVTQALKGPFPDQYRSYIPYSLLILGVLFGLGLGTYYGTEPVAAIFEGLLGAAAALGFYQVSSRLPLVQGLFGSQAWFADKS